MLSVSIRIDLHYIHYSIKVRIKSGLLIFAGIFIFTARVHFFPLHLFFFFFSISQLNQGINYSWNIVRIYIYISCLALSFLTRAHLFVEFVYGLLVLLLLFVQLGVFLAEGIPLPVALPQHSGQFVSLLAQFVTAALHLFQLLPQLPVLRLQLLLCLQVLGNLLLQCGLDMER